MRRAGAARKGHNDASNKKMRRGAWQTPRNSVLYNRAEEGCQAWEHDSDRSVWFYIKADVSSQYYDNCYKEAVGIERLMSKYYMELLEGVPSFGALGEGDPKRGRWPQPLEMKEGMFLGHVPDYRIFLQFGISELLHQ